MNIKTRLFIQDVGTVIGKGIGIIFLPLVKNVIIPLDNKLLEKARQKHLRDKQYVENLSVEEIGKRYAKYLIKYMLKIKKEEERIVVVNKLAFLSCKMEDYDYTMIERIKNFHYEDRDSILYKVKYTNKFRFDCWDIDKDARAQKQKEMITKQLELEKELRTIVVDECIKLGAKISYKDESDMYGKYFLDNTGYTNTIIIKLR